MVPQVLSNIQVLYPPAERGRAMGLFTSVIGLAAVVGPVLGAVITSGDWFGPELAADLPGERAAGRTRDRRGARVHPGDTGGPPLPHHRRLGVALAGSIVAVMLPITLGPRTTGRCGASV